MNRRIGLAAGLLLFALCAVHSASNLLFVWKYWWRLPFWDQADWQVRYAEGGLRAVMLGQFNEHRWIVPAPFFAADIEWFHASGAFVQVLLIAAQLATFAWLLAPLLRRETLPSPAACALGGLFLVWATWLEQCDNLCWPLQFHTTLCNLLQVAACWCFARGRIASATALGVVATFTFGNGFLLWPALALASAARRRWRDVAVFVAVCAICIAAYSIGYKTPEHHVSPLRSFDAPLGIVHYFLMWVARPFLPAAIIEQITGAPVAFLSPRANPLPALVALAGLLAFAWILFRYHRANAPSFHEHFYVPLMALSLGTGLVISISRMNMGISTALASRYVTLELLFWASLIGLLTATLFRAGPRPATSAAWGALIAILAAATLPANREMGQFCRERAVSLWQESAALRLGVFDEQRWSYIVEDVPRVRKLLAGYERHGRLAYAHRGISPVGDPAPQFPAGQACRGAVEQIKPVPANGRSALAISGWSWNPAAGNEGHRVLLVDSLTKLVEGVGYVGMLRVDVERHFHDPTLRTSGFVAYTRPLDPPRPLEVWIESPGARYCSLGLAQP
ncbi:MAG: hypothetical protein U0Q16_29775 [Bryobacteraceae bacterium]